MKNLLVDVGNTETVVGLADPDALEPERSWRYSTPIARTGDELRLLLSGFLGEAGIAGDGIGRAVIASVVPVATDRLLAALSRWGIAEVLVVDAGTALPIQLDVEEPRTVGPDRIVNTLAAARLYGRDTVVVDLGTATTYDVITGDGVFKGGVIAPGLRAGMEWLGARTAKLPSVQFRAPERVIGRRTEDCLESGIFYSAVDAIDGIVTRIEREWEGDELWVVATGGYAAIVADHSRVIAEVAPNLTLTGLQIAGNHMAGTGPV
ncbi:MAG: type III pantothenate kinase [Gemmatimonadales bacterium]|nr:MAG: type III pantothenate kinase [Gemmatimonadales bacterium]